MADCSTSALGNYATFQAVRASPLCPQRLDKPGGGWFLSRIPIAAVNRSKSALIRSQPQRMAATASGMDVHDARVDAFVLGGDFSRLALASLSCPGTGNA